MNEPFTSSCQHIHFAGCRVMPTSSQKDIAHLATEKGKAPPLFGGRPCLDVRDRVQRVITIVFESERSPLTMSVYV